jgi:hypothetical protein
VKNIELKVILELIESKFGRGSSKNWINRDFEELSFEISKATKTPISSHTLKRIFGKLKTDEYYLPQKATFTALKQYCNFEDAQRIKTEPQINIDKSDAPKQNQINYKKFKFIVVITLFVSLATFIYFFIYKNTDTTIKGHIKLISTEGQIPTSAQFEYSTPNNKDSCSICYDPNFEPIQVPNGKNLKSNYYYQYPGLFKVRMWCKDKIVSQSIPVYIQSKGWEAFGSYTFKKQFDRFYQLNLKKCIQNSVFSPTKKVLFKAGIDTTRLAEVMLHNYFPTNINGDNFRLETTLKNSDEWIGSSCNSVFLIIAGSKASIQLHFANPGCSYWIHCRISEKKMDKSNENLKKFTFDMSHWQHFDIQNKNKQINILVNNTLRFSCSYRESIGEIMGVTIRFQGNGYLKDYRLSGLNGNEIFKL